MQSLSYGTVSPNVWWGNIGCLLFMPLQLWLSGYSIRRESVVWQAVAMLSFLGDMVFVILEVDETYMDLADTPFLIWRTNAYAAMALVLLLLTVILAVVSTRNFGRGLQAIIRRSRQAADSAWDPARGYNDYEDGSGYLHGLGVLPTRMELE